MAYKISTNTVIDDSRNGIFVDLLTESLSIPNGTVAQRPGSLSAGILRWNSDHNIMEIYDGTEWKTFSFGNDSTISTRAVFAGGTNSPGNANINVIDYITLVTNSNATDFGDLTVARSNLAGCSSSTRGVFGGGTNVIDYITIATTGNATDFGDLTVARSSLGGCSSSTRGVFGGGGVAPSTDSNVIDYITIATTGNATDFGDLTLGRGRGGSIASCSSPTRGVFAGGNISATERNIIDYITIATTGNATDFGDLTISRSNLAGCSSSTRGIFGGGAKTSFPSTQYSTIDYITIATTGNATDFGSLIDTRFYACGSASSNILGAFGGGAKTPFSTNSGVTLNVIEYVTIATIGNAIDFGDLTQIKHSLTACSSNHGGLN